MCIRDREEVLDAGTLIEEDVFVTGNFGSQDVYKRQVLSLDL